MMLEQLITEKNHYWHDEEGRLFMIRFLFELIRDNAETEDETKPRILEVGVNRGAVYLFMYSLLDCEGGMYTGVDPKWSVPFDVNRQIIEAEFVNMTSEGFWNSDDRKWHIIFVDGCHNDDVAALDVREAVKRLTPNGILLVHDTRDDGGPRRAFINECLGNPEMTGFTDDYENVCRTGMAIGYRRDSKWAK